MGAIALVEGSLQDGGEEKNQGSGERRKKAVEQTLNFCQGRLISAV